MPPPRGTPNPIEGPGDYDVTSIVHDDTYDAIDPTKLDLSGRSVFVVGGTKGIGKAMVLSFARAGIEIHDAAQQAGKKPPQILPITIDIASEESVSKAAALVASTFNGKLDILIICAAILGHFNKIADSTPSDWWTTMTINLRGPYLLSRSFIPLLLNSTLKTLINICSVGAHLKTPGLSSYQTSKLAQLRLTEFLSAEYVDEGLIAYAIHPGNVVTDIMGPEGPPEELRFVFTESAELAGDSVVFLAKERREWLSGRYVNCTWDLPELMGMEESIVKGDKLKVRLVY